MSWGRSQATEILNPTPPPSALTQTRALDALKDRETPSPAGELSTFSKH